MREQRPTHVSGPQFGDQEVEALWHVVFSNGRVVVVLPGAGRCDQDLFVGVCRAAPVLHPHAGGGVRQGVGLRRESLTQGAFKDLPKQKAFCQQLLVGSVVFVRTYRGMVALQLRDADLSCWPASG